MVDLIMMRNELRDGLEKLKEQIDKAENILSGRGLR